MSLLGSSTFQQFDIFEYNWADEYFGIDETARKIIKQKVGLFEFSGSEEILSLYHGYLKENPETDLVKLKGDVVNVCQESIYTQDKLIDNALWAEEKVEYITAQTLKSYIRYVANMRLLQLHMEPIYSQMGNPLIDNTENINTEKNSNFIETKLSTYTRDPDTGTWNEVLLQTEDLVNITLNSNTEKA